MVTRKVTEDYIGTCQACFGEYKVGDDGLMVLHGYKRPGDGATYGNCPGYDHKPFDHDCALTKEIIALHRDRIEQNQHYLANLKNGTVQTLIRRWEDFDRQTFKTIKKSEPVTKSHPLWKQTLEGYIWQVQRDIDYVTKVADFLQSKVDAWEWKPVIGIDAPCTGKVRGLRKAYDPVEAAAEAKRLAEKAARDAKPGKLKLLVYKPEDRSFMDTLPGSPERRSALAKRDSDNADWMVKVKQWAGAAFAGKLLIRESDDYSLPRPLRSNGSFDVIAVHLPWDYAETIAALLPAAQQVEIAPKKRTWAIASSAIIT